MEDRGRYLQTKIDKNEPSSSTDGRSKVYHTMDMIRKRYMNSFTMHALNHIVNGSWIEKIFWAITLSTAVCIAGYLSRALFVSYLNHETDTVIKIEGRDEIRLPKVYICDHHAMQGLYSFADCSSRFSESYDEKTCKAMLEDAERCAKLANLTNSTSSQMDYLDFIGREPKVSCGPCLILNRDGALYQNFSVEAMRYTLKIDESHLPLHVIISPPDDNGFMYKSTFDQMPIKRYGDHYFKIEKTIVKRLPSPYSKPPCVMHGSSEANKRTIIKGKYSLGKCLATCEMKAKLEVCGVVNQINRHFLRDEESLRLHYRDRNSTMAEQCLIRNFSEFMKVYGDCAKKCPYSCQEVNYKINKNYVPNGKAGSCIRVFVYFDDLKETIVEHVPRLDIPTLLANFGGQLGLMAGVSAISIVELIIWMFLLLVHCLQIIYRSCEERM